MFAYTFHSLTECKYITGQSVWLPTDTSDWFLNIWCSCFVFFSVYICISVFLYHALSVHGLVVFMFFFFFFFGILVFGHYVYIHNLCVHLIFALCSVKFIYIYHLSICISHFIWYFYLRGIVLLILQSLLLLCLSSLFICCRIYQAGNCHHVFVIVPCIQGMPSSF